MTRLYTIAEMQALEAAAERAGHSAAAMMETAGRAVAEAILNRLEDAAAHKFLVLCGSGHNGGDGLVAAHFLSNAGARVTVYAARPLDPADPKVERLRAKGLLLADADHDRDERLLTQLLASATLVVDALLGTGARFPLTGASAELLRRAGAGLRARTPRPFIVAVDCPSGLDCDTGALDPLALPADLTVTFAGAKRGHFAFPGADALGELVIAPLDLPAGLPEAAAGAELAAGERVRAALPRRPRNAHKGTFGRALVVAGSRQYVGAAYLAAAAAYRVGAGLVTLAVPETLFPILAGQLPEAVWLPLPEQDGSLSAAAAPLLAEAWGAASAGLVGPGLGLRAGALLEALLAGPAKAPLVVDADGLRLLARLSDWPRRLPPPSVLTPHPGEMTALTGLPTAVLQADRIGHAQQFARAWGQIVLLKGAFTVAAAPDGRTAVLPFATPALARAGTGDVLAGAITGLLAQGLDPFEATVAGAYLHGRAGELAAAGHGQSASVLAGDVLAALPAALTETNGRA